MTTQGSDTIGSDNQVRIFVRKFEFPDSNCFVLAGGRHERPKEFCAENFLAVAGQSDVMSDFFGVGQVPDGQLVIFVLGDENEAPFVGRQTVGPF